MSRSWIIVLSVSVVIGLGSGFLHVLAYQNRRHAQDLQAFTRILRQNNDASMRHSRELNEELAKAAKDLEETLKKLERTIEQVQRLGKEERNI